ncbi:MAG TPA: hypothetical protein VMV92_32345 [Streptosporangiaceae bacterium]|nr:hypothetical protein [Streptosporangiaceae bacterium]
MASASGTDLVLAGHRVRMTAEDASLLRDAVSVLVPPCAEEPVGAGEPGWQVDVSGVTAGLGELCEQGRPVLAWPDSGTRLSIVDAADGVVTLAARYRTDSPAALVEADLLRRRTRVLIPEGDPPSRRWADWVARAFFGTRLLADGWLLFHAAAVRITAGGRALLVLAGPQGGKSTLAHRACVELGAQLMADDLVLLRPGTGVPWVAGWPTRVCVPAELLDDAALAGLPGRLVIQTAASGRERRRVVLSPPEYQRLLGIGRAGPAELGGVLALIPAACSSPGQPARAGAMGRERLAAALAEAARVPAQRLRMLDLLGVAGRPAMAVPAALSPRAVRWDQVLAGVPAACLELADGSLLPQLPVWDLLEPYLPWLRGGGT